MAAFVCRRATQKAKLVQYLEAHRGSVTRVLNSEDSINTSLSQQPLNEQALDANNQSMLQGHMGNFAAQFEVAKSPASTVGSRRIQSDNSCTRTGQASPAVPLRAASPALESPGSARRASVSAYLQGKQDLVTTVTVSVPYADGESPRRTCSQSFTSPTVSPGRGSSCSCEYQQQQQQQEGVAGGGNRHTVIKEALHARLTDAGEHGT